jgi:Asp-tRNA(Asn)/Glu-tRNA(Gln) amidotransferase A subunit family amidase
MSQPLSPSQDLTLLSAAQVSEYLKSGAVSAETYARALIERVDRRDKVVKAWRHLGESASGADNLTCVMD